MKFLELAKKRYSVRSYSDREVEDEKIQLILEAGRVAPTAANRQPQRILVIREKKNLQKLAKGANVFGAPLVLVICSDKDEVWIRNYDGHNALDIDASIVTDHMMLQATELGLGSLWVCQFNPHVIREEFSILENFIPVNILAIGYGEGEVKSPDRHWTTRKPLEETVFFESFD